MTASYNGFLDLDDAVNVTVYWDAPKFAAALFQEAGLFDGVFWREELYIESLLPLQVLAHVHFLVRVANAEAFDDDAKALFARCVRSYPPPPELSRRRCRRRGPRQSRESSWADDWPGSHPEACVEHEPNIKDRVIETEYHFTNILSYKRKSFCARLAEAYISAWPLAAANNREQAWKLNGNVDHLLALLACERWGRPAIGYSGVMSANSSRFVGVSKDLRRPELVLPRLRDIKLAAKPELVDAL
jgi:hypothetical protein